MRLSSLGEERLSPQHDHPDSISERKVKLSNFPKDHYWFRSQKDREDSVMETAPETIYDDGSEPDPRDGSSRTHYVQDDDASSS